MTINSLLIELGSIFGIFFESTRLTIVILACLFHFGILFLLGPKQGWRWTPASEESDFKVSLIPVPLEDGMYTLRVTNEDSLEPYEIKFEVINESQITNFYPYPNPFSTSVRFVFTVTGMEVPDEIKIQIMTVTGKVVREILQNELGPIRIGNNLTEYAWDGRDEFGDQLANGVYIYRVLIRKNGQFMEHRPTAGDKAFKKGYGKMYLLR
jgi:hypothetical protein